jgi:hypothetical protein
VGRKAWTAWIAAVLVLGVPGGGAEAQEPAAREERPPPSRVLALDAEILAGAVSFARLGDDGVYRGLTVGIGPGLLTRMLLSGRHFSHPGWPSYETSDGSTEQTLAEIAHLGLFQRRTPSERAVWELGVRASLFIHHNSFDDDVAAGYFVGGWAAALVGWRRVKVGPRVLVGLFTEPGGAREPGILLVPLTGRVEWGW